MTLSVIDIIINNILSTHPTTKEIIKDMKKNGYDANICSLIEESDMKKGLESGKKLGNSIIKLIDKKHEEAKKSSS